MNTRVWELELQRRDQNGRIIVNKKRLEPSKIAIVVVDMWDYHPESEEYEAKRTEVLVPRMNKALEVARTLGVQVIFLPTDVILHYRNYPQRKKVLALKHHDLPQPIDFNPIPPWPSFPSIEEKKRLRKSSKLEMNYGWTQMDPNLKICEGDMIAHGEQEMYNICKENGITNLLFMGCATNICVLAKPGALLSMTRYGLECILIRDMTEASGIYLPGLYTRDQCTTEVIAEIERRIAPSIDIVYELKKLELWQDNWIVDYAYITPWGERFYDYVTITLSTPHIKGVDICYTVDGSKPTSISNLYTEPFSINKTCTVKAAAFKDGKRVSLISQAGFLKIPPNPPLPDIYLSDLEQVNAILGFPYGDRKKPELDRSIGGNSLKIRGKKYKKGLGVHAVCELVYNIKSEYERFVAIVGIDDEILGKDGGLFRASYADVTFQVLVDDKLLGESPVMRVQNIPWAFDLEIPKGSKKLRLLVNDCGNYPLSILFSKQYVKWWERWSFHNYMDHADWVNAGFIIKK
jgi:nicotinamidase-related amidase